MDVRVLLILGMLLSFGCSEAPEPEAKEEPVEEAPPQPE